MGWPQNAYVGQKVVCVNVGEELGKWDCIYDEEKPKLNELYTIREVVIYKGCVGFRLTEIVNKAGWYGNPIPFKAEQIFDYWRFRPVQSTEKGMEILRGLLNTHSDGDAKILEEFMKRCELVP